MASMDVGSILLTSRHGTIQPGEDQERACYLHTRDIVEANILDKIDEETATDVFLDDSQRPVTSFQDAHIQQRLAQYGNMAYSDRIDVGIKSLFKKQMKILYHRYDKWRYGDGSDSCQDFEVIMFIDSVVDGARAEYDAMVTQDAWDLEKDLECVEGKSTLTPAFGLVGDRFKWAYKALGLDIKETRKKILGWCKSNTGKAYGGKARSQRARSL